MSIVVCATSLKKWLRCSSKGQGRPEVAALFLQRPGLHRGMSYTLTGAGSGALVGGG